LENAISGLENAISKRENSPEFLCI